MSGGMARRLYEAVNLNSVPYMFRDVPPAKPWHKRSTRWRPSFTQRRLAPTL